MGEKINVLSMHRKGPFSYEIFLCEVKLFLDPLQLILECILFCCAAGAFHQAKIIVDETAGQNKKIFPFFILPLLNFRKFNF